MKIAPVLLATLFVAGCASAVADQPAPVVPVDFSALPLANASPQGAAEAYARLAQARAARLADLQAYTQAGQFPTNAWKPAPAPCFVGDNGVYCAVGYLMVQSGHQELADRIAQADNFIVLADHPQSLADDWIASSGLTFEECALIQPSYEHMYPRDPDDPLPRQREPQVGPLLTQQRLRDVLRKLNQDTPQALGIALQRALKPQAGQGHAMADTALAMLVENPHAGPMLVRVSSPGAAPGPWRVLAPGRCCRVKGPGLVEWQPSPTGT